MSKLKTAYNNQELLDALKDRDGVIEDILKYYTRNMSDDELDVIDRFNKLTQFQKDLLYLSSTMSMYDASKLYGTSASILYKNLREIHKILKG